MSSTGQASQMAFCHECAAEIRPIMAPDPTCPLCNGQFVEIIEENAASRPQDFDRDDEEAHMLAGGAPFVLRGGAGDLGSLIQGLLGGAAAGGRTRQEDRHAPGDDTNGDRHDDGRSEYRRAGRSQFGPSGVQWDFQYGSAGQPRRGGEAGTDQVQTLSSFLNGAFGPQAAQGHPDHDAHFHDDGMGGAGSGADGRRFNYDNQGATHEDERNDLGGPHRGGADVRPELAGLRDLFTGLFGGNAQGGGIVFDFLNGGGEGGRGQWGDYVLGQQGLDDIITNLMEQTQSSNAPPPADDEEIDKLERFNVGDTVRVLKAKNRDCPTCKEDFLPEEEEVKADLDDPPEALPEDEQQEELIAMPCGHLYHEDCLVPWLKTNGTCPVCRISIAKKQQDPPRSNGATNGSSTNSTDATDSEHPRIPGSFPYNQLPQEDVRERARRAAEERQRDSHLEPDELD